MIRAVSAPAFVATKLEAFIQRGHGDILGSHDLEDVLNIVDGREELGLELDATPAGPREAIREILGELLAHADFVNALPGLIADPDRTEIVLARLRRFAR